MGLDASLCVESGLVVLPTVLMVNEVMSDAWLTAEVGHFLAPDKISRDSCHAEKRPWWKSVALHAHRCRRQAQAPDGGLQQEGWWSWCGAVAASMDLTGKVVPAGCEWKELYHLLF